MHLKSQGSTLFLSGKLTVRTINAASLQKFEEACAAEMVQTLDLQAVEAADSACISLLLTAQRLKKGRLTLINLPSSVLTLAELYEISEWVHS